MSGINMGASQLLACIDIIGLRNGPAMEALPQN